MKKNISLTIATLALLLTASATSASSVKAASIDQLPNQMDKVVFKDHGNEKNVYTVVSTDYLVAKNITIQMDTSVHFPTNNNTKITSYWPTQILRANEYINSKTKAITFYIIDNDYPEAESVTPDQAHILK